LTKRPRDYRTLFVCVVGGLWGVASLAFVLIHAAVRGLTFAGPYGLLFPGDQLRYLAWIREAGLHGLIADPYRPGAPHVYLQPMFLLSGLLWRVGLSIQAAYLAWTPVSLGVLICGFAAFIGRFLRGGERAAALALGLLFFSPLVPALDWGGIVNANGANDLVIAASHVATFSQAWGYLPTTLALGLMALFLAGFDELLAGARGRAVGVTAFFGLLAAWLDPWAGIQLLVIVALLLAWRRPRPGLAALAAVALPLAYYAALVHLDHAWSLSHLRAAGDGAMWYPLAIVLGPLALAALPAARPPRSASEQLLVLWPLAALIVYIALGPDARASSLEGSALPLSVLAVRGWRSVSRSALISAAALVLAVVPGAVYGAQTFHDVFRAHAVPFALAPGEQQAVDAVEHLPGALLATPYLGFALPALAGRASSSLAGDLDAVFDGRAPPDRVRQLIRSRRIAVVVTDCERRRVNLRSVLASLDFTERDYGCAHVYQLSTPFVRVRS